jgi:diguanylate cyclase (GGDEF)-like protein
MMISERSETLVVAVIDDDDLYREYISTVLTNQRKWRILNARDSPSMIALLDENPVDCILLDYNMGDISGLTIHETITQKYPDPPPIIMLSGEGGERTIIKAFRAGFSDFVSKRTTNTRELLEAIRSAVDRNWIERAERSERDRLARLSGFDGMTGLHGVDFIRQRAEELSVSARRRSGTYGAVVIRIRELTGIHDAFGNTMRDRVLAAFATRIKTSTRGGDICGRFSEDGFLYLIDRNATPQSMWSFCERLSVDLSFEVNFENAGFALATNMGMALFPLDGESAQEVLSAAELALARARESGVPFAAAWPATAEAEASPSTGDTGVPGPESDTACAVATRQVDRRSERRHRVVKHGKVISGENNSVVECRIRDVSNGGARISVNEYYSPPDQFVLLMMGTGEKRAVTVRWRIGNDIGVQYLP